MTYDKKKLVSSSATVPTSRCKIQNTCRVVHKTGERENILRYGKLDRGGHKKSLYDKLAEIQF